MTQEPHSTPSPAIAAPIVANGFLTDPSCAYAPGDRVLLWVDHPAVGAGERPFIVLSVEALRVRLYSAAALVEIQVSRREFDSYAKQYGSLAESVLAILKRNIAAGVNPTVDDDLAQAVSSILRQIAQRSPSSLPNRLSSRCQHRKFVPRVGANDGMFHECFE